MLGDVVEDHLLAYWRETHEACLAEIALDVVLACIAHSAVRLHRGVCGLKASVGAEEFGHVCLTSAWPSLVVEPCSAARQQARGIESRQRLGQRKRDALVLADRATEDNALRGVAHRLLKSCAADAYRLVSPQGALRIEPVQ